MKSISSVKYRENSVFLQVISKEEVECAIMKENSSRFRLAHASPTLKENLHCDLGQSREGPMTRDVLSSQEQP